MLFLESLGGSVLFRQRGIGSVRFSLVFEPRAVKKRTLVKQRSEVVQPASKEKAARDFATEVPDGLT